MGQALGCVQVKQSKVAVRVHFGKFDDVLEPGCHCMPWCFGCKVAGEISLRVRLLEVRRETKAKDNVFVKVVASIQYRALPDKMRKAIYKLSNANSQIWTYVFDAIFSLQAMSAYGFEIVQTLILDIVPDVHVKRAMNEINAEIGCERKGLKQRKSCKIKRAEGEAESKYLVGLGIARQLQDIVHGLIDSVLLFSENVPGTTAKDVMDMVLVTQYFDTMKEIGASSKSSSVIIPHGPGVVKDIASQIREGLLQADYAKE